MFNISVVQHYGISEMDGKLQSFLVQLLHFMFEEIETQRLRELPQITQLIIIRVGMKTWPLN